MIRSRKHNCIGHVLGFEGSPCNINIIHGKMTCKATCGGKIITELRHNVMMYVTCIQLRDKVLEEYGREKSSIERRSVVNLLETAEDERSSVVRGVSV